MHPAEDSAGLPEQVEREMPQYVSHKTVWALELATINPLICKLSFAEKGYAPIKVEAEMFARYVPVPGDFYVVYADGYKSFSPRKAFLEGYTRAGVSAGIGQQANPAEEMRKQPS